MPFRAAFIVDIAFVVLGSGDWEGGQEERQGDRERDCNVDIIPPLARSDANKQGTSSTKGSRARPTRDCGLVMIPES